MPASHDPSLVALSVLISIMGAYAAWALSVRVRACHGWSKVGWLVGGAIADGTGTWSMHYTAKLALRLPVPILFHGPTVALSWLVGVVGSGAALLVLSRGDVRWGKVLLASVCLGGVGISGLHYTAMAAMRLPGMHSHYRSPALVPLSVALAVVISVLALATSFRLLVGPPGHPLRYHGSAVLRGMANPVMHYTAMAAVTFEVTNQAPDLAHAVPVQALGVLGISIVPVMVLVAALLTTLAGRLNRQRALLDELFEQAPQAVALLTADGRIVRVNREFTRMFGYAPTEATGRRLGDLIVPEDGREEERRHIAAAARGERIDGEAVRRRKDGSRVDVAVLGVPVSVPGGQVEVYAIYRDITERRQAEAERDRLHRAVAASRELLEVLSRRLIEAQEAERAHLARELHDEIGQVLTTVSLTLEAVRARAGPAAQERLDESVRVVGRAVEQIRSLSLDLRPASLDLLGLETALRAYLNRRADRARLAHSFASSLGDERLPSALETVCFRVVQEATTNVLRHARATRLEVELGRDEGGVRVVVRDDGVGFDVPAARERMLRGEGFGLLSMWERVQLFGGQIEIHSAPGRGTTIRVRFPLSGMASAPPP